MFLAGIDPNRSGDLGAHRADNRRQQSERPGTEITGRKGDAEQAKQSQDLPVSGVPMQGLEQACYVRPHSHGEQKTHQMRAN